MYNLYAKNKTFKRKTKEDLSKWTWLNLTNVFQQKKPDRRNTYFVLHFTWKELKFIYAVRNQDRRVHEGGIGGTGNPSSVSWCGCQL